MYFQPKLWTGGQLVFGGEEAGLLLLALTTDQYLPIPLLQLPGGEDDGWQDVVQAAVLGHDIDVVEVSGEEEPQHNLILVTLCPVLQLHEARHVDNSNLGACEGDGKKK